MKNNESSIKYHLEVVFLSVFYADILIYINQLDVVDKITYSYSVKNFIFRFGLYLLIGLVLGNFAYRSKDILSYKSVRNHIIIWMILYTLITIFTPLVWLKIIEVPAFINQFMFESKLVYLGEQLIILVGYYLCLLGYYSTHKKADKR